MDEITVSAKTLDDAITEALIQLGVTSDKLDYDVIEKGSAGFLGIGMKQAVIKARKKKEDIKPEPEIKIVEPPVRPEKKERPVKAADKRTGERKEIEKKEKNVKEKMSTEKISSEKAVTEKVITEKVIKDKVELAKVEEKTIKACEEFLSNVIKAMDMDISVTSKIDEEGALSIDLDGNNVGILIGKRGQTLDSLQYLTNRVANKMQDGYVRVKLDTEDYRKRRKETLENLAKNIAHKVKKTRKSVSLEPMNPYERRIIHSALQTDRNVTTHSEGEEPYRRVVVTLVRK